MGIGASLKKIRKGKGYSAKEFAEKIKIPYSTYSNYENNNREPSLENLQKICGALDIMLDELMGDYPFRNNKAKEIRESLGLSAKEFSEEIGVPEYLYVRKETGELPFLTEESDKICDLAGLPHSAMLNSPIFENQNKEKDLLHHFNRLNDDGQDEAVKSVKILAKVPEYKK